VTRDQETQLFDHLFRHRPLREWLDQQLAEQVKVLLVNPDMDTIRKAQGAAAFIKSMQDRLAAAESAVKRQ
jgi:hypothetical protein